MKTVRKNFFNFLGGTVKEFEKIMSPWGGKGGFDIDKIFNDLKVCILKNISFFNFFSVNSRGIFRTL